MKLPKHIPPAPQGLPVLQGQCAFVNDAPFISTSHSHGGRAVKGEVAHACFL